MLGHIYLRFYNLFPVTKRTLKS